MIYQACSTPRFFFVFVSRDDVTILMERSGIPMFRGITWRNEWSSTVFFSRISGLALE